MSDIAVEVQWTAGVWTDVTAQTAGGQVGHGAAGSNPDRPNPAPARGHLVLAGRPPAGADGRRRPCRILIAGQQWWSGWMSDPSDIAGVALHTRWRLAGRSADLLAARVEADIAAGTTAALLAHTALAPLGVTARDIASRALGRVEWSGPAGGLLSRAAAAASAELAETADGDIAAVGAHRATAPAPEHTAPAAITAPAVLSIGSDRRTDRIRNSIVVAVAGIHSQDVSHSAGGAPTGPRTYQLDVPIAGPDGAAHIAWSATVTAAEEHQLSIDYVDRSTQDDYNRGWRSPADVYQWAAISGVTAAVGTPTATHVPVTVTVPAPTGYTYTVEVGRAEHLTIPGFGSYGLGWGVGSRSTRTRSTRGQVRVSLTLTSRVSGGDAGQSTVRVSDAASIAAWGERTLELPSWYLATTPAEAQAAARPLLAALAQPRAEHTVTLLASHPAARADCGDYAHLSVTAAGHGVEINRYGLIVYRRLALDRGGEARVELTCREIPATPPTPPPGTPRQLSVRAASATAIDADWAAPATGGPVASYTLRWRPRAGGAWRSRTGYSGRSGRISSLAPATAYEVQVRANGADASSAWTPAQTATTLDAPPRPVTGLTVGIDSGELDLSWTAPTGGGTVLGYDVEWTSTGQWSGRGSGSASTRSTSHTISGLVDGTPYAVRVRAHGPGGESAWVEGSGTPRAPVAPGAVQGVSAVPANGQIAVGWNPPATGDPATGYRVEWRTGSGAWSGADKAATARTHTISGLANGTAYTVRVRAANAAGAGPWTSATATPAEVTLPPAPAISISRQIGSFHRFAAAPGSWGGGRATNRSRWQRWLVIGNVGRWVAYGRDPESTLHSGSFTNASRVRVQCEWQPTGTSGLSARIWSPWTEWTASGQSGEDTDPRTPLTVDGAPLALGAGLLHTDEART